MSSLLADLTPLTLHEPLQDGDLCWCHSPVYNQKYNTGWTNASWCYALGCEKTVGRPTSVKALPKIYFGIRLPTWTRHTT